MNTRFAILLGAIASAAALAACGGSSSPSNPQPIVCAVPAGTQVALVYPVPGATGVPDSPGQVVIAASPALPNSWEAVLQSGSFQQFESVFNTIPQSSVPTPMATPSFSGAVYQSSGLAGPLAGGSTYTVALNNEASNCYGYPAIGSFTTQ